MTQPQASGPAQPPPFAAMLRGAVIPTVCTAPVIVLVFWVTRQTRGGLAALLGVSIAVAFFASGLYVMKRVTNANPLSVLGRSPRRLPGTGHLPRAGDLLALGR